MEEMQPEYTSEQWLFIDSSKVSWKAVLLHEGNKFPSVPLADAVHMQEMWENLQGLLQIIRYEYHRWNICADLKVTEVVTAARQIHKILFFNIYILLTAIGLTPGGSSTVHIYTQTIHRTKQ
jgi:hypothetical protein